MTGSSSLAGRLLVATPHLTDPNFDRTVVLLIAHGPDGALGVVLNRPTEVSVDAVLPGWEGLVTGPKTLFEGGPVGQESAVCLGYSKPDVTPVGWTSIDGRIGALDLSRDPFEVSDGVEYVRVFAGYSGWGSGQLESELEQGAWFVFHPLPSDPFGKKPENLWPMVLRRQGGLIAAVAQFPPDPTLN